MKPDKPLAEIEARLKHPIMEKCFPMLRYSGLMQGDPLDAPAAHAMIKALTETVRAFRVQLI
ncbi:hypothetical protein [Pantoea sp. C2G6]|uniref:hypothetical protein n=1 Tax=Pantoea sp. C2G6 TaxID=3243084 RepID=UPI003EDB16EC